jgi:hypothetical protein
MQSEGSSTSTKVVGARVVPISSTGAATGAAHAAPHHQREKPYNKTKDDSNCCPVTENERFPIDKGQSAANGAVQAGEKINVDVRGKWRVCTQCWN